jgi:hypothetical protein
MIEGQTTQKKRRTDNTKEKDRQHKRKEGQTTQKKRRTDNTKEKKDKKTNNPQQFLHKNFIWLIFTVRGFMY